MEKTETTALGQTTIDDLISRDGPTRKCATSIPTANHVNNAVFASMLETGRVELLYNPDRPLADPEGSYQ